jgi:hypothetical protein
MVGDDPVFGGEKWIVFRDFGDVLALADCILLVKAFQNWNRVLFEFKHFFIVLFYNIVVVSLRQLVPGGQTRRSLALFFHSIEIISEQKLGCRNVLDWPENWERLHFGVKLEVRSIQERNELDIGIVRVRNHWADFVVDVPGRWLVELFAAGQAVAACDLENVVEDEVDVLVLLGLGARLEQQAVLVDEDFVGDLSWDLFVLDQLK